MNAAILALLIFGQANAAVTLSSKINPPLKDVASDKKFFGPPFPADYPEDKRPVPDKNILDQVTKPGHAYPALQNTHDYDSDYVKDENSDKGAWQAQFEYDRLRRKLAEEEADSKRAQDRADKEGRDADGAKKDDDAAGRAVDDAAKSVDDATRGEDDAKKASDFDGPPSHEKLEELKKAVKAAEEKYEQQKKAFEECQRQLDAAKKDVEDLKAAQKAMEEKLDADTKLYIQKKAAAEQQAVQVKLNLQKSREEKQKTVSAKVKAAQEKLAAAEKVKVDMEKALAKEKAEHDKAKTNVQKAKGEMDKIQQKLTVAGAKLQELHGYKPAAAPTKSSACMNSMFMSLAMIVVVQLF